MFVSVISWPTHRTGSQCVSPQTLPLPGEQTCWGGVWAKTGCSSSLLNRCSMFKVSVHCWCTTLPSNHRGSLPLDCRPCSWVFMTQVGLLINESSTRAAITIYIPCGPRWFHRKVVLHNGWIRLQASHPLCVKPYNNVLWVSDSLVNAVKHLAAKESVVSTRSW